MPLRPNFRKILLTGKYKPITGFGRHNQINYLYLSSLISIIMKNNILIILVALLAVLICLVLVVLLFYAVTPRFLLVLSSAIGIITGVFITVLTQTLVRNIRNKRAKRV